MMAAQFIIKYFAVPATFFVFFILPKNIAAHGSKHLHTHEKPRDHKTASQDSLTVANFEAMHRLKTRVMKDFESFRLHYDYQQTADKYRLYHDENGIDRRALVDDIAIKEADRLKNAGKIPENFVVIPGQEVSTREGHILALFTQSYIPTELTAAETIAEIHRQGGLAIAPHPMEPRFGLGKHVETLPLDGMVLTGASVSEFYRSAELAKRVKHRMAIFMDTDAHSEDAIAWSGYTIVKTTDSSPEGIRAAIRNRQTRPVYRKTIQSLLSATQKPIIRQWFAPVSFYHASKEKIEDVLSNILLADAIEVETLVESPLAQITDLYGLPKYFRPDARANFLSNHIIKRIKIDYGRLRIVFNSGENANIHFRYKFAWLPGRG